MKEETSITPSSDDKKDISQEMEKFNSTLTGDERAEAEKLSKTIDIDNEVAIMNFAVDTQKKLGDSTDKMLQHVKTSEAGEAGEALQELVQHVQAYDVNESGWQRFLKTIGLGGLVNKSKEIITAHKNVEANLEGVKEKLDESRVSLTKANTNADILIDENVKFLRENKINVEAIRIKQNEIREKLIPDVDTKIKSEKNPTEKAILVQKKSQLQNMFTTLDKKVTDLEIVNTATLQSLPRLEMIKAGNIELATKIQSSILHVLPLWKGQIAEALQIEQQREVAEVMKNVSDITNQMIRDNASRSKESMLAIAKESERGIIDMDTLEESNKKFFETIAGVIEIRNQGAKDRKEAIGKLTSIKKQLHSNVENIQEKIVAISDTSVPADYQETEFEEVTSLLTDEEKKKAEAKKSKKKEGSN